MAVPEGAKELIGTHYRFPDYFDVGREKVREFAQAVKDDAQAGFYRPARRGVLGQGADHRQQLCRGQVRAERDLLPGPPEQPGEAVFHRAAQGADGRGVVAQRFPDPGAHARVLGRAPVIQLQPLAQRLPHIRGGQRALRGRVELVHPLLQDRREQVLAGREAPVEGSLPDAGGPGDVFHGRIGSRLREDGLGRGQDRVMVPLRVGTHQLAERKGHEMSLTDKWTLRPYAATVETDVSSG